MARGLWQGSVTGLRRRGCRRGGGADLQGRDTRFLSSAPDGVGTDNGSHSVGSSDRRAYDRAMADALLPLRAVTSHLRVLGEHYVGLREIPIDQIVGSVDRSVDFDRLFRTRRKDLRRRMDALKAAFGDRPLPPITVYEAGGLYFVV